MKKALLLIPLLLLTGCELSQRKLEPQSMAERRLQLKPEDCLSTMGGYIGSCGTTDVDQFLYDKISEVKMVKIPYKGANDRMLVTSIGLTVSEAVQLLIDFQNLKYVPAETKSKPARLTK